MTKSLITLIGAIVSIGIIVLAVVFGVMPLLGQSFTALSDTAQASSTNSAYEKQITELQKQKARKAGIDSSVSALRTQIPDVPDLDRAFDVISGSAQAARAVITSVTRGDLAAYTARTAPIPAGPAADEAKKAPVAAQPTPQPTTGSGPVANANSTANQASASANQASQTAGAGGPATAAAAPGRQQIPITVVVNAPDMNAVQAFLDGLRGPGRLLGVDKVTVTGSDAGFTVNLDLFAFVSPASTSEAPK